MQGSLPEALYERLATDPQVARASPLLELSAVAQAATTTGANAAGANAAGANDQSPRTHSHPRAGRRCAAAAHHGPCAGATPLGQRRPVRPLRPRHGVPQHGGAAGTGAACHCTLCIVAPAPPHCCRWACNHALTVQVAGTVTAGGAPLAVMDIGAAQDLFGRAGAAHPHRPATAARHRPRRVGGPALRAQARLARQPGAGAARRRHPAHQQPVARLPGQPDGAGAGGAVHRGRFWCSRCWPSAWRSAGRSLRCWPCWAPHRASGWRWCWRKSAALGLLGSVLGIALGTALASHRVATAGRRPGRWLLCGRAACALQWSAPRRAGVRRTGPWRPPWRVAGGPPAPRRPCPPPRP